MLYEIIDGTLAAGSEVLLAHFDFAVKGNDKIAIVGPNGAGKTTLLRLIAGELTLERDDRRQMQGVRLARNVTIGMLSQQAFPDTSQTVEEILLSACPCEDVWARERFEFEQEYDRIFTGFGFKKADKEKQLSAFSGGEQTKIAMIRLLLTQPDILLLDEPTNHLDMETVTWLEGYLKGYPKAVVMVSHDRFFLDQTAEIIYELIDRQLVRYVGNYTAFREQKRKKNATLKKQYEQQQEEIARLNQLIERFKHKPKKASFARSKQKALDRMALLPKPDASEAHLFTGDLMPETISGKWVLEAEELKIGYDKPLLELSLRIRRGQKIGIIGPNGAGKSTFLKTAAGILPPLKGKCLQGLHVTQGYFDQQSGAIDSDKRVVEHFREQYPAMTEKELRQYLAAYLFAGADAGKQIDHLSGGEKSRLVLAELLCARPNFLILDEPTNHMDIQAKETLESAFKAYKGTMLFVSHDRYFISQVADALLLFKDGQVTYYPFGYQHYLEKSEKKQKDGGEIAGLVSAEEQKLIQGLKQVPKGATLLGHELSTEQAFIDWQLRLATEAMEAAKAEVEKLWQRYEAVLEAQQMRELQALGEVQAMRECQKKQMLSLVRELGEPQVLGNLQETCDFQEFDQLEENACVDDVIKDVDDFSELLEKALLTWESTCLKWYDFWNDSYECMIQSEMSHTDS